MEQYSTFTMEQFGSAEVILVDSEVVGALPLNLKCLCTVSSFYYSNFNIKLLFIIKFKWF
jgi:hypothetical protein